MELLEGKQLFDAIQEMVVANDSGFSEARAARIVRDVISGVAFLHSKGIAHRDIKPEVSHCAW